MNSLVLDLQKEAYDSNSSISTLLRKAYVVARKLKSPEFEQWISSELNGYKCDYADLPEYRVVTGQLKGFNPYHGWVPVMVQDSQSAEFLNNRRIGDPIVSLETLINGSDGSLVMGFSPEIVTKISKNVNYNTDFKVFIEKSQLKSIVEIVRNIVLDWSLKLEEDGIMGEGMTFTEEEKSEANVKNYTVNNFLGDISHSQIMQNGVNSTQEINSKGANMDEIVKLVEMIMQNVENLQLSHENVLKIQNIANNIEENARSDKKDSSLIKEGFKSIKSILESATSGLITSGLIHEIGKFLG